MSSVDCSVGCDSVCNFKHRVLMLRVCFRLSNPPPHVTGTSAAVVFCLFVI